MSPLPRTPSASTRYPKSVTSRPSEFVRCSPKIRALANSCARTISYRARPVAADEAARRRAQLRHLAAGLPLAHVEGKCGSRGSRIDAQDEAAVRTSDLLDHLFHGGRGHSAASLSDSSPSSCRASEAQRNGLPRSCAGQRSRQSEISNAIRAGFPCRTMSTSIPQVVQRTRW
jgi:hypothetical protein